MSHKHPFLRWEATGSILEAHNIYLLNTYYLAATSQARDQIAVRFLRYSCTDL